MANVGRKCAAEQSGSRIAAHFQRMIKIHTKQAIKVRGLSRCHPVRGDVNVGSASIHVVNQRLARRIARRFGAPMIEIDMGLSRQARVG